ncbi:histone acetyltransferase type B subunit 2 [Kwoniella bestiolae CBS 10118]|uniref:Histone acetyltransferase type B subunit 2 n=1 Tax=Kwoniella bestiolae CBS 10118 TaxID=1296100 RepID=A0A1B9FUT7_9TREE|nr:histone acetyltransferase type B subunit 2 [Kwoniella bestiolae CBS 10118]OCF22524.1 histone acetyltransferase type B subunit 2 [Kwoniella bestiolae CBS 10118]
MAPSEPIEIEDDISNAGDDSQVINEEYKIWKKNTPFLYDTVITHALTWPSLTCQWLPDQTTPPDADYTVHRMIIGTHTSGQAKDHLIIAEVLLPKGGMENAGKEVAEMYDEDKQEIGSYTKSPARIRAIQTINHEGEINRARYMPQNPELIATKAVSGDVLVFDRTKHESKANPNGECRPDIRLKGQSKEGYGLAWSTVKEGHILSASEDTTVAHWDIQGYQKKDPVLQPLRVYKGHSACVGDVDWHPKNDYMFASVGDDRKIMLWDTRSDNSNKPSSSVEGHTAEINSVAFAPSSDFLFLTGSSDNTIALWDTRNASKKLHSFEGHTDDVLQLSWSPHSPVHFASASADRRVHIWNLDAIGSEQTPDDAEDGPPELLFVHGGHTSKVSDISWSPNAKWHLATTAEDNILQVWEPSRHIRTPGEGDVNAMDLE